MDLLYLMCSCIDLTEYFRTVDMLGRCSMPDVVKIGLEFLKRKKSLKKNVTQKISLSQGDFSPYGKLKALGIEDNLYNSK